MLKKILAVAVVAGAATLLIPHDAHAQKRRTGNAAMGAAAGLVVGGPVGAVVGAGVGWVAGEDIARGMGIKKKKRRYWVDSHGHRHYH
jgi:hypothetical protein